MSKAVRVAALCITIVLLLSALPSTGARPPPDVTPVETQHTAEEIINVEENCREDGEEECLMRRTLAAHLDYIYTQNKQP